MNDASMCECGTAYRLCVYVNAPSLVNSSLLQSLGTFAGGAEDADAGCDADLLDIPTTGGLGNESGKEC